MKFKDIVNRQLVNLTNCDQEPIHIPGSIQPHGCLLAINSNTFIITHCSANLAQFVGLSHEALLGKPIGLLFGEANEALLRQYVDTSANPGVAPLTVAINKQIFTCSIHASMDAFLLEMEPVSDQQMAISDVYLQTRRFTSYMQHATTLQSLCQSVADETRAITGYDRVMVYRFDDDYNGEVFAESRVDEVEPFLGLHYPHTDIPAQARQLYVKNLLRLIADVHYEPVPLYTIDDGTDKSLDLSLSTLRSVSPIHIEYLKNMGVGATLTISLMFENRLWGLIACHHYSPKYISLHTRIAAQLQGHFLTSQIGVRQAAEEYVLSQKVNQSLEGLLQQVFSTQHLSLPQLISQPALLDIANANGVVIMLDGITHSYGPVPEDPEIMRLATWLQDQRFPTGFHTAKLANVYPGATTCGKMAGIIYHSLSSSPDNCIMWCRSEALQEVRWAGDPQKAIEKNEKGLSPRKSFEQWKEVKKCESLPWQKPELMAAASFANALQQHVHMLFLSREEEKQRKLGEKLKEANDELENINWIGSHDLKEPLRKIQMFASRILDDESEVDTEMITESVKRMSNSARRMQALITDMLAYSKLTHIQEGFTHIDLNVLTRQAIDELAYEAEEKHGTFEFDHLPVVKGIPFLVRQLLLNLLRNALKFSREGVPPHVRIYLENQHTLPAILTHDQQYYTIVVADNGIGFDNQYGEEIFKVFRRLHHVDPAKNNTGTGVGLALCRKIMQNLNGYITADSVPGEGTRFFLYFPQ